MRATKEAYGWNPDKHFKVPEGVPERWQVRVPDNQRAHAEWRRRLDAYGQAEPALAAELKAVLAGEPRGLGRRPGGAVRRAQEAGHPQGVPAGHQRDRAPAADAGRRLGRPGRIEPDRHRLRRRPDRDRGRAQPPLRGPRARHGGDHQRPGRPRRAAPVLRHLPGVLGLHAGKRAAGRPDGAAGGVRLDPRLDRAGRRRSHPPAGRASGVLAAAAEPAGDPPGRRPGDGRGVAGGGAPHRRADRAGAVAPGPAGDRPGPLRRGGRAAPGRVCAGRGLRG